MMTRVLTLASILTAAALGCVGEASAQDIDSLSALLRSKKTEDRRDALHRLRSIDTAEAARAAAPALRDKSPIVRATAAGAVQMLPGAEGAAELTPLLGDGSELVRKEAAIAIGKTRTERAVSAIGGRISKEKSREVRAAMAIALGTNGDEAGIPILLGLLAENPKEDDEFIRRSAARSIGQIVQLRKTGQADSVTPRDFLPDAAPGQRLRMSGGIDTRGASASLLRIVSDPRESADTVREAVYALGTIGDPAFRGAIEPLTRSEDTYLARIATEALARLRGGDN